MAKKKSALTGLGKSLANHAGDETTVRTDFTDPPPGITGGIAQLTSASIGVYAKGKYEGEQFFRAAGVIVSPKRFTYTPRTFADEEIQTLEPETVDVAGLYTSIMIPLCDTEKADGTVVEQDEHVGVMLNELRNLGADTSEVAEPEDLEALLEALVEEGPHFKFGTSSSDPNKDYPTPRTWQNWYGNKGLEDYEAEDVEDEVVEEAEEEAETEEEPEPDTEETIHDLAAQADENGEDGDQGPAEEVAARAEACGVDHESFSTWAEVAKAVEGSGSGFGEEEDEEPEVEDEEEEAAEEEESLGTLADDGDEDAIAALTTDAEANGLDTDDYPTWVELEEALPDDDEEEKEGEEPYVPEKGDVVLYKPPGARKAVECEVDTLNVKARTSTLKRLDDGKSFPKVSWDSFAE